MCFADPRHGIAVGHDEVILVTSDGGDNWQRTHYDPLAQQPLLDVWCGDSGRAIAVGAYRRYLSSEDGGASWRSRKLDAQPAAAPRRGALERSSGRAGAAPESELQGGEHFNRIVAAGGSRLYIAAEAGHLYRSDDGGQHWLALPSPYAGSFFGVLPLQSDTVLAFGLRGKLFRSEDAGLTWKAIETRTVATLDGGAWLASGRILIVGLSGVVLHGDAAGLAFTLAQESDRSGMAAVIAVAGGTAIAAGEGGVRTLR